MRLHKLDSLIDTLLSYQNCCRILMYTYVWHTQNTHTRTRAYVKRANKTAIDIVIIIVITIHQHQHRWQLRFLCNSNVNSAFVCACTVYSMYINIHASRLFYCCNFSFGDWRLGQRVRMSEHDHPHSLDWPTNRPIQLGYKSKSIAF